MDYRSADLAARVDEAKVYGAAIRTSLTPAPILSKRLDNTILLKREDLQPSFSFKIRGAANKILSLSDEQVANGVICSSAGNHAQGVAAAARSRGVPATIVMPESSPRIKVDAVKALGGTVILHGEAYDDAQALAFELADRDNLCFVHPFDDIDVIAGQGTIGREILDQLPENLDAVFIPVGGGGLAAGIATYIKANRPSVRIYGVEPVDAASMTVALEAGHPVALDHVGVFADGVAVKKVGDLTFELCRQHLDAMITVTTDELCAAIRDIFNDTRTVVEPAGALAVAAIHRYVADTGATGQTLVAINCGANMNFDRLGHVTERTALGDHREILLAVEIPERKGSFLEFCTTLGDRHVTEFNYRHNDAAVARIFVGVELRNSGEDRNRLVEHLAAAGYKATDLSNNEVAKLHLRHLTGGVASEIRNERLYRFEFPEHRGALLRFLHSVGIKWDITLFHYRNHGSDYGRVLVGIDVPPKSKAELETHLDQLAYSYWDESDNEAYRLFLR